MLGVLAAVFLSAGAGLPAVPGEAPDTPRTSSTSLEGEWHLRILDLESGRPQRFKDLVIEKAQAGTLFGRFVDPRYGEFRDASLIVDDDGVALSFKTARELIGWLPPQAVAGGEIVHEAQFADGRFTGLARDADGKTVLRWYARRRGEDDDYGALLAGRTFRLKIIDQPDDFCRETYSYRDDGTMTSISGDEALDLEWRVAVDEKSNKSLVTRIISTNGKPDCQGDTTSKIGAERSLPIVFYNGGGYAVCAGPDRGLSCYGVVTEVADPRRTPAVKAGDGDLGQSPGSQTD